MIIPPQIKRGKFFKKWFIIYIFTLKLTIIMPSKFFGNRFDKKPNKQTDKTSESKMKSKAKNQNNRAKSSGIRKVGRGG